MRIAHSVERLSYSTMRTTSLSGVGSLFREIADNTAALAVANRDAPAPLHLILESLFDNQPVEVTERFSPDHDRNVVQLVEEGNVIATSSLEALAETILLVNSDRYMTGVEGKWMPAVLAHLDEIPFTVRGYPHSHREKLLLIAMSRLIEHRALAAGSGTIRAAFQHVSGLTCEPATRRMYESLAETDLDIRLFGYGDHPVDFPLSGSFRPANHWAHRNAWVVSFVPDGTCVDPASLLAIETGPNLWDGFWTFDIEKIDTINRWVDMSLDI